MHRLSQWLEQPVQRSPCCSCSFVTQMTHGNAAVILLPQPLRVSRAWPRRGRDQATQTMGHLSTLRTTGIVKLHTGRAWVSISASKVRQPLRSLCSSFGLRGLKVCSDFFERHHNPVAEFRSLWMSLTLAPRCAFVLLTICFVKVESSSSRYPNFFWVSIHLFSNLSRILLVPESDSPPYSCFSCDTFSPSSRQWILPTHTPHLLPRCLEKGSPCSWGRINCVSDFYNTSFHAHARVFWAMFFSSVS